MNCFVVLFIFLVIYLVLLFFLFIISAAKFRLCDVKLYVVNCIELNWIYFNFKIYTNVYIKQIKFEWHERYTRRMGEKVYNGVVRKGVLNSAGTNLIYPPLWIKVTNLLSPQWGSLTNIFILKNYTFSREKNVYKNY